MTEQPPEQISGHERNQAEFLREEFERNGRLGRDDIRWLLDIAEGKSEQPPEVPQREHEFIMIENSNGYLMGKCSCGVPAMGMMTLNAYHSHVASLPQREEAPQPPSHREPLRIPVGLHEDTAQLVMDFASAMASKLFSAQEKYGYSDNWKANDWADECRAKLREHLGKGDPRDVANYCAFLWYHKQSTAPAAPAGTSQGLDLEGQLYEKLLGINVLGKTGIVSIMAAFIRTRDAERVTAAKLEQAETVKRMYDDGLRGD